MDAIEFDTLADDARGLAALPDGTTLSVAGATPGDRLRVEIEHRSPHRALAWGRLVAVESRGPHFVEPPCPHAAPLRGDCGGCPAQHVAAELQLATKRTTVEAALAAHDLGPLGAMHAAPAPLGYRNRGNFVVGRLDGRARLGSWAPRSHRLARMDGCLAVRPAIAGTAAAIETLLDDLAVPCADEDDTALRYVVVRANDAGDVLVEWIARAEDPPWLEALVARVVPLDGVIGQTMAVNQRDDNVLRGEAVRLLHGQPRLVERVGPLELEATASGFLQLHSEVAAQMYAAAADWLPDAPRVVWDLYCGAGGLGLTVARHHGAALFGSEVHEAAVELARDNAARNGVAQATFAVADLRTSWPAGWPAPDAVLVNPPRRGIDRDVLERLAALPPEVPIVYMSCNPKTFARDVARLCQASTRQLRRVEAWDMLPQTSHVEVLGTLSFSPA